MALDNILLDVEERMTKSLEHLKRGLSGIRTGRANPGLVESVKVLNYGVEVPLKQVATIACPEPTQLLIRPFDITTLKDIEKGIANSGLGYTPNNDGKVIRLNIPPLSMEVRRKMVKTVKDLCEECKVAMRRIRQDGNKQIDALEKSKEISEDQRDKAKTNVQNLTKKFEDNATDLAKKREDDVINE